MTTSSAVAVPTASVGVPMMTESEARACVNRIKANLEDVRAELFDLREREGWRALGYANWRECITAEFHMSQSRAYQLLNAHMVDRILSTIVETPVPETHAREVDVIREDPEAVKTVYTRAIEKTGGKPTQEAIRTEVDEHLARPPRAQKPARQRSVITSRAESGDFADDAPAYEDQSQETYGEATGAEQWCQTCGGTYRGDACPCTAMDADDYPTTAEIACTECGGEITILSEQDDRARARGIAEQMARGGPVVSLCEACQLGELGPAQPTGFEAPVSDAPRPAPPSTKPSDTRATASDTGRPNTSTGKGSGKPSSDRPAPTYHPLIVDGKAPDPVYPTAEGYLNGIESHLTSEALDEFAQRFTSYYRDVQRRRGQTVTNEQPAGAASVADLDTAASALSPEQQVSLISRIGKRLTADQLHRAATFFEAQARLLETREQLAAAGARL